MLDYRWSHNPPPTGIEPTRFRNSASKVAGLQVHATAPDEVRKISPGQGDDYTTGCLLDYAYFKNNYKLIGVDLIKQRALDVDPSAIKRIVFQEIMDKN